MKSILLIVLIFFSYYLNDSLKSCSELLIDNVTSEFEITTKNLKAILPKKSKVINLTSDTLDLDVIHYKFHVKVKKEFFSVSLLTYQGDAVRATSFVDLTIFEEPITEIETIYDSATYNLLNTRYKSIYNVNANLEELNPSQAVQNHIGYICYGGAEKPKKGKQMYDLVLANNSDELLKWVSSLDLEKKIYGYIGLSILDYNPNELKLIKKGLLHISTNITLCDGCFVDPYLPLNEFVGSNQIDKLIDLYKNN